MTKGQPEVIVAPLIVTPLITLDLAYDGIGQLKAAVKPPST